MIRAMCRMSAFLVAVALPLSGIAQAAEFEFIATDADAGYDIDSGEGSVEFTLDVQELNPPAQSPAHVQGFSMDLTYDGAVLNALSAELSPPLQLLNGGQGPVFAGVNLAPEGGTGITAGIVFTFTGGTFMSFESRTTVIEVTCETVAENLMNDEDGLTTSIEWGDTLGDPEVINILVVAGESITPSFVDGTVELAPRTIESFRRADPNGDGTTDIADAVWLLNLLFLNGPRGTCKGSDDANRDGHVDQSDPIFILNYKFLHGPTPPAPFQTCGVPGAGEECDNYLPCR